MKKNPFKSNQLYSYLTGIHLEWLGTNQSVWVHRKMTGYMILTQMTLLCKQKHSIGFIESAIEIGGLVTFLSVWHLQSRNIFLWHLLKSHSQFFIQKYTDMKTKFSELLYAWSEKPVVIFCQISCVLHILS